LLLKLLQTGHALLNISRQRALPPIPTRYAKLRWHIAIFKRVEVVARTRADSVDAEKISHFRNLLIEQLRQQTEQIRTDQAAALELHDDGVKDSVDLSVQDLNKEIALRLGERSSKVVADIDQALLRIKEGSYGICARCGQPIDERRLEAVPTARYDARCQALIESANGDDDLPTL
jgi:DnaK suppressor protein